jgi:hypothetical protein
MNGEYRDNIDNYADWEDYDESLDDATRPVCMTGKTDADEMTEEDWDRYSRAFESRYNEHMRSVKSSGSRSVGRSTASKYYDEDGISSLLPTIEEIEHYRRALGCDDEYNLRMVVSGMCRPHEDTMAEFFLENCF